MSDVAEKLREFADNCLKLEAAGGNEGHWLQISHDLADGAREIDRLNDALVIARTTNANLLSYADEQRRLLQECWNAHVGASAGFSSDLWDRVRDAVMEGM